MATPEQDIPGRDQMSKEAYVQEHLGRDPVEVGREEEEDEDSGGGALGYTGELLRSAGRGAVRGLVTEPLETVGDLTGVEALETPDDEWVPAVLGKRSDDGVARFVEGTTQALSAFVGLGKIRIAGKALSAFRGAKGLASAMGRGAAVDFAAFDPFEGDIAGLIERTQDPSSPIPDLSNPVSDFLAVDKDDSNAEARLKQTAQGFLLGATVDGLMASLRVIRGRRALEQAVEAGDDAAAREAAQEIEENAKIINDVAEGTHSSDADQFVDVQPAPEGWRIVGKSDDVPDLGPFRDRAEAEAQAASIESNMKARTSPNVDGRLSDFQKQEVLETAENIRRAAEEGDEEALARLQNSSSTLNLSHYGEDDATMSVIEAMDEVMEERLRGAMDEVPIAETVARARAKIGGLPAEDVEGLVVSGLEEINHSSTRLLAADMYYKNLAEKAGGLGKRLQARPHDEVAMQEARDLLGKMFKTASMYYGGRSEIARTLRLMQDLDAEGAGAKGFREVVEEADEQAAKESGGTLSRQGGEVAKEASNELDEVDVDALVAGMEPRQVRAITSMLNLTSEPRHMTGTIKAVRVLRNTDNMAKAQEFFLNSILSAPTTLATVAQSGFSLAVFEPGARILAGMTENNPALRQEGKDLLYGLWKFAGEGFDAMRRAWRAGHTIIDDQPTTKAIGGFTGEAVRLPSRAMLSLDEFIKTVQYRSWIRAKTLRNLRGQGLSEDVIEQRVKDNLKAAFDEKTGVATIPEGMEFAKTATMSSPLSTGSTGRAFSRVVSEIPVLRFIAPFTRAPANLLAYARDITPGINRLARKNRQILKEGGEEAALLRARERITGMMMTGAVALYASGHLTGGGPEDRTLRKNWLRNHQPYSFKNPVTGKWTSFRRMDPIGLPFGVMADVFDSVQHAKEEYSEVGTDALVDAGVGVFAGLTEAISNRSYLRSVAQWMGGLSGNQMNQLQRAGGNLAGGFVPFSSALRNFNPDNTLRQTRGMVDQIKRGIPVLSETLPATYNLYGEKVYKSPTGISRFLNMVNPNTAGEAPEDPVIESILSLGKGFSPPSPTKRVDNQPVLDLTSNDLKNSPDEPTPYEFWMKEIRESGLREDLRELVESERFKEASAGTPIFKGGRKEKLIQQRIDRAYSLAWQKVRMKYPKVRQRMQAAKRAAGMADISEDGPQSLEDLIEQNQ